MKRRIITITFLLIAGLSCFSQTIEKFKVDFEKALNKDFSADELNEMFRVYSSFLTPHSDVTQFWSQLTNGNSEAYPLFKFKQDKLYIDNIDFLFYSKNINHRILSYLLIAASNDKTYEEKLLTKIKEEKEKSAVIWSGMALLHLGTNRTTPLFEFIIENENFGDSHMIPLLFNLQTDSLINTAFNKIESDDIKSKILAAQILSKSEPTPKVEKSLKKAVKEWDIGIKGYAIYSLKELQIGNLLPILEPLLDSTQTRNIALEALGNSKTAEDREYFNNLFEGKDSIPEDLLDCLFKSKRIENTRLWLRTLVEKKIPEKYFFLALNQPLLFSDEILPDIQKTLIRCNEPQVKSNLVRVLSGREDDESIKIFIKLLRDENSTVRHWTAHSLKGTTSQRIIQIVPELLQDKDLRTVELVEIAIENGIDTLQNLFDQIYENYEGGDWRRRSIEYLSYFPKPRHKDIFRNILEDSKGGSFIKRNAAIGLANLNDKESIDLIYEVMRKESEASDYNAQVYLIALGKMKSEKAKSMIAGYKNSDEEFIRNLVNEILNE
ncbi:MAG TPA: hypothetical protein ENK52_05080 [Saprospiraceae bacterium]|nr:hypothetical protein [Saprospiraceae bacterium]